VAGWVHCLGRHTVTAVALAWPGWNAEMCPPSTASLLGRSGPSTIRDHAGLHQDRLVVCVALRDQPVPIVIVRDPSGRRRDEAFLSTDRQASVAFILQTYASRWRLEGAFRDGKQHLGFEDPQQQVKLAVRRTAPLAFIVYDLTWLWAASRAQAGQITWVPRPWYRQFAPSSMDLLTALRHEPAD
jgi:hypothetical protein